jgi:hypothetical protein
MEQRLEAFEPLAREDGYDEALACRIDPEDG